MAKDPSKTEEATPKQRDKQREEGNVPKSQEFTKMITLLGGVIILYMYFGSMISRLEVLFKYFFEHAVDMSVVESTDAYRLFYMVVTELFIIAFPVLIFLYATVYLTMRLQVGSLWTTKVFKIRWENFNIFKGIQKLFFSTQTFVRLAKSIALALVIGYIPYLYIMNEYPSFINLYYTDVRGLGAYLVNSAFWMVLYTLAPMAVIGIADLAYTRYEYEENIKMTKQEVKDEHKQADGDPIMKQKQKQKMFEIMTSRMMQDIPRADVVITNPTHYAVALMYDPTVSQAPLVVAKGVDHLAHKIREIATEHKVPIRENKALARALYAQVEVGQAIPEDLYKAVASILAQIWKMKGRSMPG